MEDNRTIKLKEKCNYGKTLYYPIDQEWKDYLTIGYGAKTFSLYMINSLKVVGFTFTVIETKKTL